MHTLATRSHGIFCEKYLSKTTNTLLYISTRVSPIAFKIFLRVPRCLGTSTAVITRLRQNAGSGRFSQIRSHIYIKGKQLQKPSSMVIIAPTTVTSSDLSVNDSINVCALGGIDIDSNNVSVSLG